MCPSFAIIDSFDHDTNEPRGLRGEALDRHVLSTAKRVSYFWITETAARAGRIQHWLDTGQLVIERGHSFPWHKVVSFNPEPKL